MKYFDKVNRVGEDACAIQSMNQQNDRLADYMLFNTYERVCSSENKRQELTAFATENHMRIRDGYGIVPPCTVDQDSSIRMTNVRDKGRTQMFARTFQANPDLSRGKVNIENESRILQGDNTWDDHSCTGQKTVNSFIPMIPCLANSIQNPDHIIESWVRGGDMTRDTLKQKEFLEKNGYNFDAKRCMK